MWYLVDKKNPDEQNNVLFSSVINNCASFNQPITSFCDGFVYKVNNMSCKQIQTQAKGNVLLFLTRYIYYLVLQHRDSRELKANLLVIFLERIFCALWFCLSMFFKAVADSGSVDLISFWHTIIFQMYAYVSNQT